MYVISVYMQLYPASSPEADVLGYLQRFRGRGKIKCDECASGVRGEWCVGVRVSTGWVSVEECW